jgi:phosphatidylglycerol phospholipase C
LASYRAAILEGAEGIESGTYHLCLMTSRADLSGMADVHATTDGIVVMFHDPTLDRTTDGKGAIKEQAWFGNIECVFLAILCL